ncbi:zinc-binding dehydrogenase [Tersicoccus sp. MR15.9]|uniref:zinc-binding dehydrogenase n=1 Tax=Tersicoccus mangrovi TaxID=3121635 RepID=UPI002FE57D1D
MSTSRHRHPSTPNSPGEHHAGRANRRRADPRARRPAPDGARRGGGARAHRVRRPCGTDLHIYEDDYASELPIVQGHELSGTVVEVADDIVGADRLDRADAVAADTLPGRLGLARELGADHTLLIDPAAPFPADRLAAALGDTAPDGPPLVLEATGVPAVLADALDVVAPVGRVVQIGISVRPTSFPLSVPPFKEVDLLGSRNSQGLMPQALDLIARHQDAVRRLITHRFAVADLVAAFTTMRDPDQHVGNIIVDMPGDTP